MRILTAAVALMVGTATFAAEMKRSSESIASETEKEFTVPVPKSEIALEPLRFKPSRPSEYSISATTWVPENFTRNSYLHKVSAFQKTDIPALTLNRFSEIYTGANLNISSKLGLTYLQMQRTADRSMTLLDGPGTETMNFVMARAGVESAWPNILPWGFEPNMSFAVLPTWITAQESVFEDGVGEFGLPFEATAGLLWRSPARASIYRGDLSVGVSYQAVNGTIGGSSLRGHGVLGELRISL